MKKLMGALVVMGALVSCAPARVEMISGDEFARYSIPKRIIVVPGNRTDLTLARTDSLARHFAEAGFAVVDRTAVERELERQGLTFAYLLDNDDYLVLADIARIDALVLVKQFYGTEVRFIETETGTVRASGCWRTSDVAVVNDCIDQILKQKVSPRLCPVKME